MSLVQRLSLSATSVLIGLLATQIHAQTLSPQTQENEAEVQEVVVTGSRIARAKREGATPVTVITSQEIDARGHRDVFDVLTSTTSNLGFVQGEDYGSTFTPAANFANLRGLGPNHSLVLLNGHRLADYPIAYGGSVNAVNLSNFPSASLESIEILSGSAGAIYGSDAIAGVINLKLKRRAEGVDVGLRVGSTSEGGGENQKLSVVGGKTFDRLDVVYGLEVSNRRPIWYGDRDIASSYTRYTDQSLPLRNRTVPPVSFGIQNPLTQGYFDVPAGACEAISDQYFGTLQTVQNWRSGAYCGSDAYYFRTIQTAKTSYNGSLSLTYALNDQHELYADALYSRTDIDNSVRAFTWNPVGSAFYNVNTGRLENWRRAFSPEELGGRGGANNDYEETAWTLIAGVRGDIGGTGWRYDVSADRSEYESLQGRLYLLNSINSFFLGEKVGDHVYNGVTYASYAPDANRLFTPLTPDEFKTHTRNTVRNTDSWTENLTASLSGTLWQLPAGPLQAAFVAEAGRQGFSIIADPTINQGLYYNVGQTQDSRGTRKRNALGAELRVPVFDPLTLTLAGRYDTYDFAGKSISKDTWNLGIEYRPIDTLLVRGSVGTSFRAPDMNYIFTQATRGYYPSQTDYYQCRLEGSAYGGCTAEYNAYYTSSGTPDLEPENGESTTFGVVWSPSRAFDIQLDYYEIKLEDQVAYISGDALLRTEADCRIGQTPDGTPVDANSALCQDYLSRVTRNAPDADIQPNQITNIRITPVNAAYERIRGLDLGANLRWSAGAWGRFHLNLAYAYVIEHEYQQFAGDPVLDRLSLAYASGWRDRANATLNWTYADLSASLHVKHYGRIPRTDEEDWFKSYTLANASVSWQINDRASVGLIVNNLFNREPLDTSGGWPNYPSSYYDIYGRQVWLQVNYHFGPGGRG